MRGRRNPRMSENNGASSPPMTPSVAYANSSRAVQVMEGMRNMGSEPMNPRMTTTLEMAASTRDPRTAALQLPITSSMTKRMAEMGALNAAARPAAAPIGANMRRRRRDRRRLRAMMEATPAPIWSEGSSARSEWPAPMATAGVTNLPMTVRMEMKPS